MVLEGSDSIYHHGLLCSLLLVLLLAKLHYFIRIYFPVSIVLSYDQVLARFHDFSLTALSIEPTSIE